MGFTQLLTVRKSDRVSVATQQRLYFSRSSLNSDLKKMVRWFDILKKNNVEIKLSEPEPQPVEATVEKTVEVREEAAEEIKPSKKKTASKKK